MLVARLIIVSVSHTSGLAPSQSRIAKQWLRQQCWSFDCIWVYLNLAFQLHFKSLSLSFTLWTGNAIFAWHSTVSLWLGAAIKSISYMLEFVHYHILNNLWDWGKMKRLCDIQVMQSEARRKGGRGGGGGTLGSLITPKIFFQKKSNRRFRLST